jgi:hypothetical protein
MAMVVDKSKTAAQTQKRSGSHPGTHQLKPINLI